MIGVNVSVAEEFLGGEWDGEVYRYYAAESRTNFVTDRNGLEDLGRLLQDGEPNAYSIWCARPWSGDEEGA